MSSWEQKSTGLEERTLGRAGAFSWTWRCRSGRRWWMSTARHRTPERMLNQTRLCSCVCQAIPHRTPHSYSPWSSWATWRKWPGCTSPHRTVWNSSSSRTSKNDASRRWPGKNRTRQWTGPLSCLTRSPRRSHRCKTECTNIRLPTLWLASARRIGDKSEGSSIFSWQISNNLRCCNADFLSLHRRYFGSDSSFWW